MRADTDHDDQDRTSDRDEGMEAMSMDGDRSSEADGLFDRDEVEGVLSGSFYRAEASSSARSRTPVTPERAKPTHYKVICISMYTDALARLDAMVVELKRRGFTKANRSALIRHALERVDLDQVPRGL
ncbi:MAG: hypothetical protein AAGN82_07180 [Myxococcota bacterium]